MKRSFILVISCVCALAIALFALTACGGSSDSSGSSAASSTASSTADGDGDGGNPDDASAGSMSSEEIRAIFEQAIAGMSEFYKGTTPVGEQLYYAGGADGEAAILVLVVPDNGASAVFIGPAAVGEDNKLTITDETTGAIIAFDVFDNEDGTYSFSMGDQYGAAVMSRCSSNEVIDALVEVVMTTSSQAAAAAQQQPQEGQSQE
mgnify:CR=1 FL=1